MRKSNNLSQEQCPVCRNVYANVYLKRRHMGVLHGLDENRQLISVERREYLRCQSARHYVPKRNRMAGNRSSAAIMESTSQPVQPPCDYTTKNAGIKFALVDPAIFDCRTESDVRSDEEIEHKVFPQMTDQNMSTFEKVCIQEQKHKKTSLPAYTKNHLQWSRY